MKKPRVAVIGLKGLPSFGGAARVGESVIEELKNDYQFTVYSTSSHASIEGDLGEYDQLVFKQLPNRKLNSFYYYFVSSLHALFFGRYDLVHLHHVDGGFMIPFLRLRYKVIGTSHGRPQELDKWKSVRWFFIIAERLFLWSSSIVTVVAKPLQETYKSEFNFEADYIPNGIHLDNEIDEGKPYGDDYLLFAAGRIMEIKGCHTFLEALRELDYKGKALVVGNMNQTKGYEQRIRDLADGLNVEFLPLIKEKPILYSLVKNAKLFVFPSLVENMSIMMLEVATMRTPLICSDIPQNKAVFGDDETLFFKTSDSKDLAQKITFALEKPDVMQQKVEQAYKKLIAEYSWQSIAAKYSAHYQSLL